MGGRRLPPTWRARVCHSDLKCRASHHYVPQQRRLIVFARRDNPDFLVTFFVAYWMVLFTSCSPCSEVMLSLGAQL